MKKKKSKGPPLRRTGGRSARVVASVQAAVMNEMSRVGYDALSIVDVAALAGVHETSVYRRWPTKAELVTQALISHAMTLGIPDTGSLLGDIDILFQQVNERLITPAGRATSQVVTSQNPALVDIRRAYWASRRSEVVQLVQRAKARGELPAHASGQLFFEMLVGPILLRRIIAEAAVSPSHIRNLARKIMTALGSTRF